MNERAHQPQESKLLGWWTLSRDVGSFLAGWVLVFMEVQRTDLRESVLVFASGVVGVPVAAVGLRSVAEAIRNRQGGTDSQSSPSPEEASSPSSGTQPSGR